MAMASGDVERAYRMNASAAGIKVSNFPWMDDDALFVFVFVGFFSLIVAVQAANTTAPSERQCPYLYAFVHYCDTPVPCAQHTR